LLVDAIHLVPPCSKLGSSRKCNAALDLIDQLLLMDKVDAAVENGAPSAVRSAMEVCSAHRLWR
jgi:hypothetical protein